MKLVPACRDGQIEFPPRANKRGPPPCAIQDVTENRKIMGGGVDANLMGLARERFGCDGPGRVALAAR